MSNPDAKHDVTALVIRSAHDVATRSSLVTRGLRDITTGFQEDTFQSAEDRAEELFDQSKFEEAIAICNSELDANPKDEVFWLIKAMCFSKAGKDDELLECALSLIEINGQSTTYWYLAARVLHRLGRFEGELEYWRKLIQMDPQYEGAWRGIGDCLFNLGRYKDAAEAFDSELKLNSSDDYCSSRKEIATAALHKRRDRLLTSLESADFAASLMVSVQDWWAEPSPTTQLAMMTHHARSFNFSCSIENISDQEQLLGKELTVIQYSPSTGQRYWVADALILDSDVSPQWIKADSEWSPVTIEVTWLCSREMSDLECVQEFLSDKVETLGCDDRFGTVLVFY